MAQNIIGNTVDVPQHQRVINHTYSFFFAFKKRGEFANCFIPTEAQKEIKAEAKHKNANIEKSKCKTYLLNI